MKVWVTKDALNLGIRLYEKAQLTGIVNTMVECTVGTLIKLFHNEGRDWHRTEEAARARVEKMRLERIAYLKRQLRKLETMQVKIVTVKADTTK